MSKTTEEIYDDYIDNKFDQRIIYWFSQSEVEFLILQHKRELEESKKELIEYFGVKDVWKNKRDEKCLIKS